MKKISARIIASIMLVIAITFFIYALNHPEATFPWSNTITYAIYVIYFSIMCILFIVPFKHKK